MKLLRLIFIVSLSCFSLTAIASDNRVFLAMQDELQRSMEKLKFDKFDKPYYLSYRLVDSQRYYISASLGSTLKKETQSQRELVVDLRVGNYQTDNSHLFELNFSSVPSLLKSRSTVTIPLEADYTEIRRQLWLATDSAYKKAVQDLAKKQAILAGKDETDRVDDFLQTKSFQRIESENKSQIDMQMMANMLNKLSAIGNDYPQVQISELDWLFVKSYTRFIDSEGGKFGRNDSANRLLLRGETQTDDGETLFDEESIFSEAPHNLPDLKNLKKQINARFEELKRRREAPMMNSYVGPVLFKPEAAAELLRQTIAKQAVAHRPPEKDSSIQIQGFSVNTLQGQIKQRILPRGFSVSDEPLLKEFAGQTLLGSYWVDDQGVEAKPQQLIKNGRLVQLVSERSPVAELQVQAGNHIDGSVSISNLLIQSKESRSTKKLEQEMLALSEELGFDYGIVIERLDGSFDRLNSESSNMIIFGGDIGLTLDGLSAYKLYKDGRKQILRQVQIPRFDIRALKDIVAAGDDYSVNHGPAELVGANFFSNKADTQKYNVSSFITPSLLLEELSITAQENSRLSLPVSQASN